MKMLKNKIYSWFYNRTKLLQAIALFSVFLAIGFKVTKTEKKWIWIDYPFIAWLLICLVISVVILWVRIEKHKLLEKINEIKEEHGSDNNEYKEKLHQLTPRQNEVLQLIISGKSNKEIIELMFIEPSTLKTHINKIYKALEIKTRKELRIKYKNYTENN
jgi:DNA-binding CsgD family transcriptional regulator